MIHLSTKYEVYKVVGIGGTEHCVRCRALLSSSTISILHGVPASILSFLMVRWSLGSFLYNSE